MFSSPSSPTARHCLAALNPRRPLGSCNGISSINCERCWLRGETVRPEQTSDWRRGVCEALWSHQRRWSECSTAGASEAWNIRGGAVITLRVSCAPLAAWHPACAAGALAAAPESASACPSVGPEPLSSAAAAATAVDVRAQGRLIAARMTFHTAAISRSRSPRAEKQIKGESSMMALS